MRFALWTIAIAAAAVGLALALRQSEGYVVIVSAPWRVELSLNLLLVGVLAGYVGFHVLMRLAVAVARAPARVRAYREERARATARNALNDALLAFFQGRYASAEKSAAVALADAASRGVAAIVAARSAHELGRFAEREAFLGQATGAAAVDEARLTTLADLLLSQGKHAEALAAASELVAVDPRNARARRLLLEAQRGLGQWDEVLRSVGALASGGELSVQEAEVLQREAHLRRLEAVAAGEALLGATWENIPPALRADAQLAGPAARLHLGAGDREGARAIVEAALARSWDPALVALYADCAGDNALPLIERAEAWLPDHARDPVLLLALGKLCVRQSLWGKAQSYLEASLALQPSQEGHMTLAALLERLGKPQEAGRHFRRSAELSG